MHTCVDPATLLKHIYDSATDFAIFTTGLDGKVTSWNSGAERILGFTAEDMIGNDIAQIFTPEDIAAGVDVSEMTTAESTGRATDYRWHMRKDGYRFWADGVMTPIRNDTNEIIGFLKILQDITRRKEAQDEIGRLATIDSLTGLANRSAFETRIKDLALISARSGDILQLLLIDLDGFKEVNDTYGHHVGDELLRHVALRLKETCRGSDFIARLGGDEFGILQIVPSLNLTRHLFVTKLVECLAVSFKFCEVAIQISASVGIASYPEDGISLDELLKKADLALYKAKSDGRNCFHFYTNELDAISHKRIVDSNELRSVVKERRFWLEYQPIVDSSTGRAMAMEALIRFPSPILSGYSVDYTIDLAKEIGLISEIGAWVFGEACMQLMRWKRSGIQDLKICINTCAKELLDMNYLTSIKASVTRSGAAECDIEIELTERDAIALKSIGSCVLDTLSKEGFNLSLDDFGTGYSSLSYLRTLPVATVKLDKSFLHGVPSEPDANSVAKSIVALANDLRLQVIAEGVEDQQQAQFLQEIKCTAFQGFLFSKAMLPEVATEWLFANGIAAGG